MPAASRSICGRTRRELFWEVGAGFTGVALAGLLDDGFFPAQALAADRAFANPLTPKKPHFAARAKSVIFLFMYGGPSHIDTFDYKPKMKGMDNKTVAVKTAGRAESGSATCSRTSAPVWMTSPSSTP
jgi:hypothetical protein